VPGRAGACRRACVGAVTHTVSHGPVSDVVG
jgi:hypothetical protein